MDSTGAASLCGIEISQLLELLSFRRSGCQRANTNYSIEIDTEGSSRARATSSALAMYQLSDLQGSAYHSSEALR